jgi:hypothetical protein
MKRSLSSSSLSVTLAALSQASVRGAEQACTAIAVLACAHHLFPRSTASLSPPELMELCIRQGGALYACWRRRNINAPAYAIAKEMADLVSPALPICFQEEHGGRLWDDGEGDDGNISLLQALENIEQDATTLVLTIGAFSVALFLHEDDSVELFDSHAVENQQFAALYRFDSRDSLIALLMERFPTETVSYSLSIIRKRLHFAPSTFPLQQMAFDRADELPFGFFYTFAHDTKKKSGAKEYMVAGLEDFYEYYSKLDPLLRAHYDMARAGCPVTLYLDLEFETYPQNGECNGREMLADMLKLVAAEEPTIVPEAFRIADSSSPETKELLPMSESSDDDDDDDDGVVPMSLVDDNNSSNLYKVSYHAHNRTAWFLDTSAQGAFMVRVEARADGSLRVWRLKAEIMVNEFFADQGVYTSNRCIRFVYSSKFGKNRYFLPLDAAGDDEMDPAAFFEAILSPPAPQLYILLQQQQQQQQEHEIHSSSASSAVSGDSTMSLSTALLPIRTLAAEVERHYKPERMRGYQFQATGLVTFPMIKHDCEICKDTHNNQVYVVADLKSRVFYSKCHADRSKMGPEVVFPPSLGPLYMAVLEEMQPGERASVGIFPAASYTAQMVLGFASAVFASARTAPRIPEPGSTAVFYDKLAVQYEVHFTVPCKIDFGQLVLQITVDKLVIRCKGKMCMVKGKRWDRPSHSASSAGRWQLLFLFPEAQAAASSAEGVVAFASADSDVALLSSSDLSLSSAFLPQVFLAQTNFLLALGFENNGGAPLYMYEDRLKHIEEWASLTQKAHGILVHGIAQAVRQKAHIIRGILGKEMMEVCYRECLVVAPDFVYPIALLPRNPCTLASALWIHLAHQRGYKRCENVFYVPTVDAAGRNYYRTVPLDDLLTSVCKFQLTPNLCAAVMWNGRVGDDLRRLLNDRNHFPSLPMSKRYLAYSNVVYDMEENVALTCSSEGGSIHYAVQLYRPNLSCRNVGASKGHLSKNVDWH